MTTLSLTVDEAKQWMHDALNDGWRNTTGHFNGTMKMLERDGWTAYVDLDSVALDVGQATHWKDMKRVKVGTVTIWGPDGLQILPWSIYNWDKIVEGLRICEECGKMGETVRLGFAGRVCPECRARLVDKVEFPGWCD